jgi:hypothetical protein
MSQSGVLIFQPSKFELRRFYELVKICAKHVQNVLYIDFSFNAQTNSEVALQKEFSRAETYKVLEGIYKSRAQELNSLDVRVLLGSAESQNAVEKGFSQRLDVVFLDSSYKSEPSIVERACMRYNFKNKDAMQFLNGVPESPISEELKQPAKEMKCYDTVAVGGTFDRYINAQHFVCVGSKIGRWIANLFCGAYYCCFHVTFQNAVSNWNIRRGRCKANLASCLLKYQSTELK